MNYFQPSIKLKERLREGVKIRKLYHPPATPYDRLLAHETVDETIKATLRKQRDQLDPVELLHRIRQGQSALAALSTGEPSDGPSRKSLDQFLAGLPQLWRSGEARLERQLKFTTPLENFNCRLPVVCSFVWQSARFLS
jgi:hypothetical protein